MADSVVTSTSLVSLKKLATGKVRDLYEVDSDTLLFVATDRISAYDVIMDNGIPSKGKLLTLLSAEWFSILPQRVPGLQTHFQTLALPRQITPIETSLLHNRSMQVRKLKVFPIEAIVRGYITGSAWKEYQRSGTVHGIPIVPGLQECQAFPQGPIYTPSTKAEAGQNDENISPAAAALIVGAEHAKTIEDLSIKLYAAARDYAAERGIIIADTKFEFGQDEAGQVVLVDEVLTPDSSRFWPADKYEVGRDQESFDKQYLRNWLTKSGLKGKPEVHMPEEVVQETAGKYQEAFERLTGKRWDEAVKQ